MVQIEILDGPDAGKTHELAVGQHSLGRAATNDVVVAANSVSGKHLRLTVDASDTVYFEDANSTNGTFSGGLKVLEGEWYDGSELKIGDVRLKLVAKAEDHQRQRDQALNAPQTSKLMKLSIPVIVLAGAAFAYFEFFTVSEQANERTAQNNGGANNPVFVSLDLIDNLGDFSDSEDWTLSEGAQISNATLRASASSTASLSRIFPIDSSAIEIAAKVSGDAIFEISWGVDENQEQVLATWRALLNQPKVEMPLPPLAKWMKVSLQLAANSSVSELTVNPSDATVNSQTIGMAVAHFAGENLSVVVNDDLAFSISGRKGEWQLTADGASFESTSNTNFIMDVGPGFLSEDSRLMVLADGGPIVPSANMTIDNPAGLLCGTQVDSYFFDFDGAESVSGNLSHLKVKSAPSFSFVWDMREPLTQAAREMQAINSALNDGNDSELLAACERLLRRYPLKDDNVSRASMLVRETMARGQRELADLQQQASGALFVGASQVMLRLNDSAQELASRFQGTEIAAEADSLSQLLRDVVNQSDAEIAAQKRDYRIRVVSAVKEVYPQISNWLAAGEK
ncbi:MAG: FHA domain-containing protein [Planctomycetota bacterium]|nr:FHA domain-containing protein [Planctomycetota bacterium]